MEKNNFIIKFSGIYENSSWVAERSVNIIKNFDDFENITNIMKNIVNQSSYEKKLELLNKHPDLALKKSGFSKLTKNSKNEQNKAGLNKLSLDECKLFQTLNTKYKNKFNFPFILAVSGRNKDEIIDLFKQRINNGYDEEFKEAINQVHKIAKIRINNFKIQEET